MVTDSPAVLSPQARRAVFAAVGEMRRLLEDDFSRQMAAFKLNASPAQARTLVGLDARARQVALAVVKRERAAGATLEQAARDFVRESAFTFLNRALGLRCLEERRLLLVDGQNETVWRTDPTRGSSSLYWRVRNEMGGSARPREIWAEALRGAGASVTERIRVLFDPDSEYAALFPQEDTLRRIVELLNSTDVPAESYTADDFLGWVYQYYNATEKGEVQARAAKGAKVERPEELIAVTCLYTERYIVDYLLQNTLGRLWLEISPASRLPEQWPYFLRPANEPANGGARRPTARRVRDVTLLDPCCGSGHFLLRAFDLLAAMYREEGVEGDADIPSLIIERNLHGIDIDLRAVQITAMGLYLKGCELAGSEFGPKHWNLVAADAVLPGTEPPADYMARFTNDPQMIELVRGIWRGLHDMRELGSLLHPERAIEQVAADRRRKQPLFDQGDEQWSLWKEDLLKAIREQFHQTASSTDLGQHLFGEQAAKGIDLVQALSQRYDVVVTNPPYLGSKGLGVRVRKFLETEYKAGKRDLYAAVILRCREFAKKGGRVGMVTQQSWMFLRSFADLRKDTLQSAAIETVAQLGPRAFEEISGEVVSTVMFTLRVGAPRDGERLTGLRLVGPKSASAKAELLRKTVAGEAPGLVSTPSQADFLPIPETPFVYWLRPRFFELLRSPRRLREIADAVVGLQTGDNERFTRCFWEVNRFGDVRGGRPSSGRWFRFAKGGRYQKWAGLEWLVLDWEDQGRRLRAFQGSVIRNPSYYFRHGVTYTYICRGSMGGRSMMGCIFDVAATSVFPRPPRSVSECSAWLSTRASSYLLRVTTQDVKFHGGYVSNLPIPQADWSELSKLGATCGILKTRLVDVDPLERSFSLLAKESTHKSLSCSPLLVQAALHTLEGFNERLVCEAYALDAKDVQAVSEETGTPAGWHPLLAGYDLFPPTQDGLDRPPRLREFLVELQHLHLRPSELTDLKSRLGTLYQAGPGARLDSDDEASTDEDTEVLGAQIPIPTETFLEEISQKMKLHPISVYWLLKEMIEQEGLVCKPLVKTELEDYISVAVLRVLGYRWPRQNDHEREHGRIIPDSLVDADGIIPLMRCGDEQTLYERVRQRVTHQFGEPGADDFEVRFQEFVGRPLQDWLGKDFFSRHVQQFKQRPIAWHLSSPERHFQAMVLCHRLSLSTLQKIRGQYAGTLLARLRSELERARQDNRPARVSELRLQIEDIEEFINRLQRIESGADLDSRIRCRWKDEEATGRPGPYAPDIDDGVKVNIRPFQELGLLSVKQVIKKW